MAVIHNTSHMVQKDDAEKTDSSGRLKNSELADAGKSKMALYRRHRSKSLDEVVGQKHITDTLKSALQTGTISHAYLFTGPRGVGKTSIARILAHEINGLEYTDESSHLDIIEIDAASNRRIDEIRDLREKVHIAPAIAQYKIYIIDEVHMLTREAFNALLKTLEEPPEHVIFILATTEAHKVPDTIISRTQRFNFKPIPNSIATQHLEQIAKQEGIAVSKQALDLIAEHGNGSFRDSIGLLDQLSSLGKSSYEDTDVIFLLGLPDRQLIDSLLVAVKNNNTTALFSAFQEAKEQDTNITILAKEISNRLRRSLEDEQLYLPPQKTLQLLKELLPLTGSYATPLALELCLLDAMNLNVQENRLETKTQQVQSNNSNQDNNTPNSAKHEAKPLTENRSDSDSSVIPKIMPESTNESLEPTSTKNNNELIEGDTWKSLLHDIKSKHNTLYGVLRMAQVSVSEDTIDLSFQFDFHKKRIDSAGNRKIISDFINQYYPNMMFTTSVAANDRLSKKSTEPKADEPMGTDRDDTIESVSNIFGGAELLE